MSKKTSAEKQGMSKHTRSHETIPESESENLKRQFDLLPLNETIPELPEKEMMRSSEDNQSLGSTSNQSYQGYQSISSPISDKLKAKIDKCDNYVQYFLSYRVDWDSYESLVENYLEHGSNVLQWLELESKIENDTIKRGTKAKTNKFAP